MLALGDLSLEEATFPNSFFYCVRSNQSLKLTEMTVDDFAARRWTDLAPMIGTSAQHTTVRRLFAAAA